MDRHIAPGAAALVVDGFSTGEFYPEVIRAKGLSPVHVSSGAGDGSPGLAAYLAECLQHMRHDYAAMFTAQGGLDALAERLAPLAPCCVMPGCEMGVETAELLAARLGLPGNDPATSRNRRDKLAMHEALAAAGLPALASRATADPDEALAFAESLGQWPVVLKPLRSAATEGVTFCRDADELRRALGLLLGTQTQFGETNLQVLVQQCAHGREFVVNTVSRQGRHVITDIWEYHKIPTPGGAPLYDRTMLVRELGPEHHALVDYTLAALDALGVRFGPAHTEVMLTARGPVLIESGARPMGGSVPQEPLRESLGHTQLSWALDSLVDGEAFAAHACEPYRPTRSFCIKSLISSREGELASIPAIALAARLPSIHSGSFAALIKAWRTPRTVDLLTNPAHVFLCHPDEAVVQADWNLLRELETEAPDLLFELRRPGSAAPGATTPDAIMPDETTPEDLARRALGLPEDAALAACALADAQAVNAVRAPEALLVRLDGCGRLPVDETFDRLARLAAVLRPGGRLLVDAPAAAARPGDRAYSPVELRLMLRLAGLLPSEPLPAPPGRTLLPAARPA